ncbi:unnamed protein product [Linum trigynum]|uniref:DUF620 domain-containing protein n=1 Tax=Linum trigynum TaxID=586398 RepID=A0AAV2CJG0_9ROSI
MRKLCPNYDNAAGLETVLEVPVPEEMFTSMGTNSASRWRNMRALMKAETTADKLCHLLAKSNSEFLALLKIVGAPLIPFHVQPYFNRSFDKHYSTEASTARYIVKQYAAATGGTAALTAVQSMYAVGQVKMVGSEMLQGTEIHVAATSEVGGFVVWQKNPDLWYFELVVAGHKVSAGSDGKIAWNQSYSQPGHANRGPTRPLRRFFQGLDPRCVAKLFIEATFVGEEEIEHEDCFVLKLDTDYSVLKFQSSPSTEILHHTVWGHFSHKTGLLVKFSDTKLVKMIKSVRANNCVFWETNITTFIRDYRCVEGINVAHRGETVTTLFRYGDAVQNQRRRVEEAWEIDEVDFNIQGLSPDYFLPPADLKREVVELQH